MDLNSKSKEELISAIQDYQEMVSEIEDCINSMPVKTEDVLKIRDIMEKWLFKNENNLS